MWLLLVKPLNMQQGPHKWAPGLGIPPGSHLSHLTSSKALNWPINVAAVTVLDVQCYSQQLALVYLYSAPTGLQSLTSRLVWFQARETPCIC